MRAARLFLLFMVCLLPVIVQAQDDRAEAGYAEALRRIEAAKVNGITVLELNYLYLPAIPPEIGELSQLRELYIVGNALDSVPPELWQLTELRELDLSDNDLIVLPPEIGNLANPVCKL